MNTDNTYFLYTFWRVEDGLDYNCNTNYITSSPDLIRAYITSSITCDILKAIHAVVGFGSGTENTQALPKRTWYTRMCYVSSLHLK